MASITKRGNGLWRARYRDDVEKEHAKHFDRKVDAQRWLNEVTASLVTGSYVDPKAGSVTFERFYAQWSQRQVWVPSTRVNADHAAASVPFAQVPLKSLRRSHVEQWVKSMTKDLAATTIHTRVTIVRSVLRGAVADRVIPVDPSEGVTLPRRRRREAAMQVPSVEQVGRILGGADDDFRAFVALCAFAGLRLGEAAGVQVGDVDFLRRQLAVSRQLQRDGREVAVRPPKYGSERVVYLPEQLVTLLSEHVATYRPDGEPGRWLFDDLGGPPAAQQRGDLPLATDQEGGGHSEHPAPRPAALLRLGSHRCRVRCRDRPESSRALVRNHHFEHLLAPVAHR